MRRNLQMNTLRVADFARETLNQRFSNNMRDLAPFEGGVNI